MIKPTYTVTFGSKTYSYSIIRSDRTTVGISVESDGEIIVKAPQELEEIKIRETVDKKRKWIAHKVAATTKVEQPVPKVQEPISGEKIRYKNKLYRLKIHQYEKKRSRIILVCKLLHVYVNEDLIPDERAKEIKKTIVKWYRERAESVISQRVEKYLKYMEVYPKEIQVRETQKRWGSRTEQGRITFNWRIVMAPMSAIDYVVIHELCHLQEPNHSATFWSLVEALQPNYRRWKEWLHMNGLLLDLRW